MDFAPFAYADMVLEIKETDNRPKTKDVREIKKVESKSWVSTKTVMLLYNNIVRGTQMDEMVKETAKLRSELANLSNAILRSTTLDIENTAETNKENIQILNSRIDRTNEAYASFDNVKEAKNALNSFNGELEQIKNENSGIQQNFSDLPSNVVNRLSGQDLRIQSQQDVPDFYSNKIVVLEKCKGD
ncbi:hypothetical protein ATZ36_02010 [Candidatus Endomicrobiellum trichonymphae]|jgi:hypothetical protein|uniref:Uncharacterized protein n=1 Tax=Endomicrobium trichonymphae TaxID=1408204 RepID=A0A1E5IGL9_ENDTX|nr:hypothetical protein ATZ36_02010 [Candidatus Endomicrobium trichonymphae]